MEDRHSRHGPSSNPSDDDTGRHRGKLPKVRGEDRKSGKGKSSPYSRHKPKNVDSGFGSSPLSQQSSQIEERQSLTTRPHASTEILPENAPAQILPREVASKLKSREAREFAAIKVGDYSVCEVFINEYPDVLKDEPIDFVEAAHAALQARRISIAESCIQQSLLLRDCREEDGGALSRKERKVYFDELIDGDGDAMRQLEKELNESMERLLKMPAPPESGTRSAPSQMPPALAFRPPPDRHHAKKPLNPFEHFPSAPRDHGALSSPATRNEPLRRRGTNTSAGSNAASGPSLLAEGIDSRYVVEHSKFFVVGRVFATLWHASLGSHVHQDQLSFVQLGRFKENIISHIQRMVVVKEEYGCSWCIPINTYHGRGLAKFVRNQQVTREDKRNIEAHAIIYMAGAKPTRSSGEPPITKDPIKVTAASDDQKLDEMSRLNFAKVHTVEHNVKVMNVGKIEKDSLQYLKQYWRDSMSEPLTVSGRQGRR